MPHLSKRKLDKKTEKLLNDSLFDLFSNLSKSEAQKLLSTLLTNTERLMVSKRVGASLLIGENISESKIADVLKLSTETVYKFTLIIKAGDKTTWDFVLHKLEKWQEFSTLKEALKSASLKALKTFSKGMSGKI